MEERKVKFLQKKYKDEVLPSCKSAFEKKLREAPDRAFDSLLLVGLKSRKAAILLSALLGWFSVGRFYVGDIKYGIGKIFAVNIIGAIGGLLMMWRPWMGIVIIVGLVIWHLLDILFCYDHVVDANTRILFRALSNYSKYNNYASEIN